MNFRTPFNYPTKTQGIVFKKPSMTQQAAAGECDINQIMKKYQKTGIINHLSNRAPSFGDFASIGDFQAVQAKILQANDMFNQLNSTIRKRFDNDPAQFVDFCQNPANQAEAISLGLVQPPEKSASDAPAAPSTAPSVSPAGNAGVSPAVAPVAPKTA